MELTGKIPAEIISMLAVLEENGYEAWIVGGAVRDLILGRDVHDWDITTAALPEKVMELFPHTVPTGLQHGTITVIHGEHQAEVTTFRTESTYRDSRHPDCVKYVSTLEEDLARRDFTINAMAMNRNGNLADPFQGREDLRKRLIRCVGRPEQRFREDALRMLRALRISAQLGFSVEADTFEAVRECAPLTERLSSERMRDEIEKTLLSDNPDYLNTMIEMKLLDRFGLTEVCDFSSLCSLPAEPVIRWAGLLQKVPKLKLDLLKLPGKITRILPEAVENCDSHFTPEQVRRLAAYYGFNSAWITLTLCGQAEKLINEQAAGHCMSLRELAVCGTDFPELKGRKKGEILHGLLEHVLTYPDDNKREILFDLAAAWNGQ